ncbi:hypothetical protein PUN4_700025 [Paraburkholderia unamae]|nr:hypothetical protein PUN4_700025 [Paraburkholderia unamae]
MGHVARMALWVTNRFCVTILRKRSWRQLHGECIFRNRTSDYARVRRRQSAPGRVIGRAPASESKHHASNSESE